MTNATLEIGERVEAAALFAGLALSIAAAYYVGTTGNWLPLLIASCGTGLLVLLTE